MVLESLHLTSKQGTAVREFKERRQYIVNEKWTHWLGTLGKMAPVVVDEVHTPSLRCRMGKHYLPPNMATIDHLIRAKASKRESSFEFLESLRIKPEKDISRRPSSRHCQEIDASNSETPD